MSKSKPNHPGRLCLGVLNLILLSLRHLPYAADAQTYRKMAPPPYPYPVPLDETINPPMGIILAAVATSFLIVGFFTVYLRTRFDHGGDRSYISSSEWGRRSCRRQAGLHTEVIEKFPIIEYSAVKGLKIGKGALECAVCLSEFADDETLRLIPKCDHAFHLVCIDTWLVCNPTCPVCRACLVPDPYELAGSVSVPIPDSEATSSEPATVIELDTRGGGGGGEGEAPEASGSVVNGCTSSTGAIADDKRRPGRSNSMKARITGMFSRSHTTGHSLPPEGEDRERFTLRLPEGVREQIIMNSNTLNRTKSCAVAGLPKGKSLEWESYSERLEAGGHQKWRMLPAFMTAGTRSAKVADDEGPGRGHACCDLADTENAGVVA